jgi:hypothetical protein
MNLLHPLQIHCTLCKFSCQKKEQADSKRAQAAKESKENLNFYVLGVLVLLYF